jgi:hypothetical protein
MLYMALGEWWATKVLRGGVSHDRIYIIAARKAARPY